MMDSLRGYAKGWVAQLLLGLLVISFAVWGVSDIFTGFRQDAIAEVGSTDIPIIDFQRDYDLAVRNLGNQLGMAVTPEQARQFGLPGQVLARLVNQATLDEAAAGLGLGISNTMLGQKIATDPQYFGSTGTFDRGYLSQLIRAQNMTEDQFIVALRKEYIRGQIGQAFAGGVKAPQAYLDAIHEYQNEQRDVSYIVLNAPAATTIAAPDDTALNAYFEAHKAEWNAPELRAATYFTLSPDQIARPEEVTDADAQARYDMSAERFSTVEKRQIQQIVFTDRAEAEAAAAALTSGKTFDDIIAERLLSPADIDLGLVTRDQLADEVIADAAFALAANTPSTIVEGAFGPVILRVTTIEPAAVTPFAEVKDELKQEIATERAVTEITEMHNAIEDARAGGDALADVAAKYGLTVASIAGIDQEGKDEDGDTVEDLPANLIPALFESDVGLQNDPIQPDRNSYTWYEVTAVTAPRERPLAEVREDVVEAWTEAEQQRLLDEQAETVRASIAGGGTLAAAATANNATVKTSDDLTRVTRASGDLTVEALSAVFEGPQGAAVAAKGAAPLTALVLVVDDIALPSYDPDTAVAKQTSEQFNSQFVGDLLGLYVGELQKNTNVRINEAILQQVLGLPVAN